MSKYQKLAGDKVNWGGAMCKTDSDTAGRNKKALTTN